MAGLGPLGLAHAASRGYRRHGADLRTAMAMDMAAQAEQDYARWRAVVGEHPADAQANSVISKLRRATGASRVLANLSPETA